MRYHHCCCLCCCVRLHNTRRQNEHSNNLSKKITTTTRHHNKQQVSCASRHFNLTRQPTDRPIHQQNDSHCWRRWVCLFVRRSYVVVGFLFLVIFFNCDIQSTREEREINLVLLYGEHIIKLNCDEWRLKWQRHIRSNTSTTECAHQTSITSIQWKWGNPLLNKHL